MNEQTYLLKFFNQPIDQGKIELPNVNNNHIVNVEIFSKYFNYNNNYKFVYSCSNCYKIEKLGDTINGIILNVYKTSSQATSTLYWKIYKMK